MRYSKTQKQLTKRRIVESAAALFTVHGFDGTSIDAIMRACNLTRGGFYAHFRSKSQLYREAIKRSAERAVPRSTQERDWVESLFREHFGTNNDERQRWGFLANDVASMDPEVRAAYAIAFRAMSAKIHARLAGEFGIDEQATLGVAAMLIGAAAVARSVDDSELQAHVLAACKRIAATLIENKSALAPLTFFWERDPPARDS